MANKKFILQGLTANTHTDAIKRIFEVPEIKQVILSVAFINEEGVILLENEIRSLGEKVKVFSGIRNDITSFQGLSRLLNLGTILYTVDTGARNIIFHPKIYLSKGAHEARLVIGSANLTIGGLNNNIEAGMAMDFDLTNTSEKELVEGIENNFLNLPTSHPENVLLITSVEQLELLKQTGRVLDESEVLPPRPIVKGINPSNDKISRIKLSVPRIYRTIKRTLVNRVVRTPAQNEVQPPTTNKARLRLMWESTSLTERDLNIPSGTNTNPSGSVSLDKGRLGEDIDHKHYFREEVFSDLEWRIGHTPTVEETDAQFELIVRGVSYGDFTLRIAHTMGTESAAYLQNNAMTRLSWGQAKQFIAHSDLIGRTLALYRNEEDPTRFLLEID